MKATISSLRAARERRGLTIRGLQAATGISTGRLSMLERHLVEASASERELLSAALGVGTAEIFGDALPSAKRVG